MAKSFLNTLLTIALNLLKKNGGAVKQALPGATVKTGATSASASAVPAASINFEKIKFGPFNWLVLERRGDTALIITEGIVYRGPYYSGKKSSSENASFVGATWEISDLRKYLNGKFLEQFSPADVARIVEVTNQNPDNPWFNETAMAISAPGAIVRAPKGGNPTNDKVFCLSIDEVCRYFGDSTARLKNKGFTQYGKGAGAVVKWDPGMKPELVYRISDQNDANRIAIMPGALSSLKEKQDGPFWWWLRSPGQSDIMAAAVQHKGAVWMEGKQVYATAEREFGGIRPALWLRM